MPEKRKPSLSEVLSAFKKEASEAIISAEEIQEQPDNIETPQEQVDTDVAPVEALKQIAQEAIEKHKAQLAQEAELFGKHFAQAALQELAGAHNDGVTEIIKTAYDSGYAAVMGGVPVVNEANQPAGVIQQQMQLPGGAGQGMQVPQGSTQEGQQQLSPEMLQQLIQAQQQEQDQQPEDEGESAALKTTLETLREAVKALAKQKASDSTTQQKVASAKKTTSVKKAVPAKKKLKKIASERDVYELTQKVASEAYNLILDTLN